MSGPAIAAAEGQVQCDPVCQLFINGFGKVSRYTLTNFASLFSPAEAKDCRYTLSLVVDGREVASTTVTVPPFASVQFDPVEHFSGMELPELGLFTATLEPLEGFSHLGMLRPYFYAVFTDDHMKSVAVVHPQTTFLERAPAGVAWRSAHIVKSAEIDALEVFQVNPMPETRQTSLSVCDAAGNAIVTSSAIMAGRSVRRIIWPAAELRGSEFISLAASPMTAPNAKPLMFQHRNGGFTGAHS